MKNKLMITAKQIAIEALGSFIATLGLFNFAVAANFPVTGFSGVAVIFYKLFGVQIGILTICLNIPFAIIAYKILGKDFTLRSFRCMLFYSLSIDYVAPLFPTYQGEPLLAAICTGVFGGIGLAMIYMSGTSTGGQDFITMSIKKKNPHLKLGSIIFAFDTVVILTGGFLYSTVDGIIYGIMLSFITTTVMDKVMYGANSGKTAFIISNHPEEIKQAIYEKIVRGVTILNGEGGYDKTERKIIMCACDTKQMYGVEQLVKQVDPESFIIVLESHEVLGKGFKPLIEEK